MFIRAINNRLETQSSNVITRTFVIPEISQEVQMNKREVSGKICRWFIAWSKPTEVDVSCDRADTIASKYHPAEIRNRSPDDSTSERDLMIVLSGGERCHPIRNPIRKNSFGTLSRLGLANLSKAERPQLFGSRFGVASCLPSDFSEVKEDRGSPASPRVRPAIAHSI
jgi:hypothetical protein